MNLQHKKALITGATDGLGRLLAVNLAKLGSDVIVHGRDRSKAEQVVCELQEINPKGDFSYLICDLNKPELISETFAQISTLDILINNAGVWDQGNTTDLTPERIIELTNVNLLSYLLVTRKLLPILQKAEFAQILNVSSIAGVELPEGFFHTVYSATKFGVQAFSEALVKEFGDSNLRIMGYYPGGMATDFFKKAEMEYQQVEPWMFDPQESVEAMIFMLTRNSKVNVKRLDLINHLQG